MDRFAMVTHLSTGYVPGFHFRAVDHAELLQKVFPSCLFGACLWWILGMNEGFPRVCIHFIDRSLLIRYSQIRQRVCSLARREGVKEIADILIIQETSSTIFHRITS